eukprot:scpid102880/ scgid23715/ 
MRDPKLEVCTFKYFTLRGRGSGMELKFGRLLHDIDSPLHVQYNEHVVVALLNSTVTITIRHNHITPPDAIWSSQSAVRDGTAPKPKAFDQVLVVASSVESKAKEHSPASTLLLKKTRRSFSSFEGFAQ